MRVSSTQIVYRYQQQLNDAHEQQTKMMEMSDGSKLHRPSDDAVAYSKYLRYRDSDTENLQYQSNVESGMSWMRTTNATMGNMTNILETLKEKSVDAANETNENTDWDDIAKEFEAYLNEIVSLGNTQLGDRYIFSGQSDLVKPFSISVEKKDRGLAKTLDDAQAKFFNDADSSGNYTQMLTLQDNSHNLYYLNTRTGALYTKEFMDDEYKDRLAAGQDFVAGSDACGTISGWNSGTVTVADYFKATGEINTTGAGASFSVSITRDGNTTTESLSFVTVKQPIVSYDGDARYISMVKQNGTVDQTADTVNVNGHDMWGADIFDNANSGNQTVIMSDGTICTSGSGTAMLNEMYTVLAKIKEHDSLWMTSDGVTLSDGAHNSVLNAQTTVGARQNVYESVHSMLETQRVSITTDINDVSSTDVAELAVRLMEAQTIYNMSLSVGARILPQSLADYL